MISLYLYNNYEELLKNPPQNNFNICACNDDNKTYYHFTPYINDGLVFWLDGILKDNTSKVWTDLIGGISFNLNNNNCEFNPNHVNFKSTTNGYVGSKNLSIPLNSGTIEIVCSFLTGNHQMFMTPSTKLSIGNYERNIFLAQTLNHQHNFISNENYVNNKVNICSCNVSTGYMNGVKMGINTTQSSWGGTAFTDTRIGGGPSYGYYGKIYCVRVYNRLLNEEEMLKNQRVDNIRFNLGFTI